MMKVVDSIESFNILQISEMVLLRLYLKSHPEASQDLAKFLSLVPTLMKLTIVRFEFHDQFYTTLLTMASFSKVSTGDYCCFFRIHPM